MASKFQMSPGVSISEQDNTAYAVTQPIGNVAAMIGYTEKGSFTPFVLGSDIDFNRYFGYTLMEMPYLAQAAYKYFTQGKSLLVVRAGDNRDPELYPQAAQFATKNIRIGAKDASATLGYQMFSRSANLAAGTFAPSTVFGVSVLADHRVFPTAQIVETWDVLTNETHNGLGIPSPAGDLTKQVLKVSYTKAGDSNFGINYRYVNTSTNATAEYVGAGTRAGETLGSAVSGLSHVYAINSTFAEDTQNYIALQGVYGAVALGNVNMHAGYDFSAAPKVLDIVVGANTYAVSLNVTTTTAQEVVDHINAQLTLAVTGINSVDLSKDIEAFELRLNAAQLTYIGLRHKAAVVEHGAVGITVANSDGASVLGLSANAHLDSDYVYATWNSEEPVAGHIFNGTLIMAKKIVTPNVESYEDYLDVSVTAPASGSWALGDIRSQIQAALTTGFAGYPGKTSRAKAIVDVSGKIKVVTNLAAADGEKALVRLKDSASNSLITLLNGTESPVVGDPSRVVGEALIGLTAVEKGTYGNNLVLRTETKKVQTGPSTVDTVQNVFVFWRGKQVSAYQKVSWTDVTSPKFLPVLMANDQYVRLTAEDEDGNFILVGLPDGDWVLGNTDLPNGVSTLTAEVVSAISGSNGWESDAAGNITSMDADYMNAILGIYNTEVYNFNLVAAPGAASPSVKIAIQNLCEFRHDCFGVVDATPFGIGLGIANGLNSVSEINDMNDSLSSSYVGSYFPWLKDTDADNKRYVWLPPSIYAITQMVYTDNIADPWFATAGLRRGMVPAIDVEYSATEAERDQIYGDTGLIINPIVKFVGEGIVIWGQKTAQRYASSTDRINVRRLLIYTEKLIATMARGFLFEQDESTNWNAFARQANAILEPIRQRKGLASYKVTCDITTNPSSITDQNIMAGIIEVVPIKTMEKIQVGFQIDSAGTVTITE